ncbi:hypothetical protein EW145_g4769 [Phellinidium pouzarii]|uniref:Uncharacterized protein n=1 Tax=Phellinidium pouzarii TaxID=167371 RepID=A0A4S4L2J1_9AGAM|nr:hypothetical protein EW145_g4769 [Phellinidium pouzarii]
MFVSSTCNPSARSSVHFVVVHHNDERVLVPVDMHAKYVDLQLFAAKEWDLNIQTLTFETDELDICAGQRVRIHEEAWRGIRDVVGNVYIRIRGSSQKAQKGDVFNTVIKFEEARAHTESADEDEVEQQTRPDSKKSEYVIVTSTTNNHEESHLKSPINSSMAAAIDTYTYEDPLKLFSDELGERVDAYEDSDMTGEMGEEEEESEEEGGEAEEGEGEEEEKVQTKKPISKRVERATPTHEESEQTPKNSARVPLSVTKTPLAVSGTSIDQFAQSASTAMNSSNASSNTESERVLVIIEVLGNSQEARGFRIKREHTVNTVLKGASKVFKVDYTRACFKMILEKKDGSSYTVKCDKDATIRSLSIANEQRFIIEIKEDSDAEEESDN